MKKTCLFAVFFSLLVTSSAFAQYASQKDASYIIIAKVIADHKMNDQEYVKDIEDLRENENFNKRLEKMLEKISNSKNKDFKSRQIDKILRKAGEDIEKALGV